MRDSCPAIVASRHARTRAACAALLFAAAGVSAQPAAPWRTLASGLQVRTIRAKASPDLPVDAVLVRLDPSRHELRAVSLAPGSGVASVEAPARGALALLNASYFDERGAPLGLLVSGGTRLREPNRQGWAWAAVSGGRLVIRPAKADVPTDVAEAVQAGPILVTAGRARELTSPRPARRSFLGTDAEGRIVLGATNGSVTLQELADVLARPEAKGGAGLAECLNLDGGSSSQLHVPEDDPALKVAGVPVPVFVGAFPKRP